VRTEKVLFLLKAREFGGMEIVLLDWLSRIDYSRVSAVICCYGTEALRDKLAATKLPVDNVPLRVSDQESALKTFPQWIRLFRSIGPDKIVMLEAVTSELGVTPVVAARCSGRRRVVLFEANWGRSAGPAPGDLNRKLHYGFLPGIGLYRYKETMRQRTRGRLAHRTFVVSQGIKDNLVRHYGYPAEKTEVMYHGVDTQRFRASPEVRREFRRANGIPDAARVIVSHGRLVPRKHVERILKAFETLSATDETLWVLLTCYGPLKEEVERLAAASAARNRIKLVGFQGDSSAVLKASDIYVLSSNDEGFGIALLEALSTGLLCVATEGPGPRDILSDGENGFLVEASDDGVLRGLRRALALAAPEREQFVRRGRETVVERFEIGAAIERSLAALEIPQRQKPVQAPGGETA
jgi:Glycosyl transferases group 1/Glycosyltransferase Family 4